MDGGWTLTSLVVWQLVAWPLVVLLARRARRPGVDGRALLPHLAVAALLIGHAVSLAAPAGLGERLVAFIWFTAFPMLCATYPDGRFVPRWFVWPTVAYGVLAAVDLLAGGALRALPWWPLVATSQILMVGGQVHRYRRRASTTERERVRWAVLGVLVEVSAFAVLRLVSGAPIGEGGQGRLAMAEFAALPIPVAFAIGLLRPRLVDVDAALRAVVTLLLSGTALAGAYGAVTAAAAAWGMPPGAAGWVGAAVIVVMVGPTARLAAGISAWVVYRGRADAEQAVATLAERLHTQPDGQATPGTLLQTLVDCAFLDGAALRGHGLDASVGCVGQDAEEFAVVYQGAELATLLVPPRRGETALSAHDREVVSRLAVHAAPALHGARALAEVTDAHSRLLHAREEERRRLRRDLHDDLSPTLSGLALGAAALSRCARTLDDELAAMATGLQRDIEAAVAQTREIAYDLRPAVLDDLGLVAAIRSRLHGVEADTLEVDVQAPDDLCLPAAVDLAALRIVQEAVANVRKHARARRCTVTLERRHGGLLVAVHDDGAGPPPVIRPGLGLTSIRERCTQLGGHMRFTAAPGGGGLVVAWLPVPESAP